MIKIILATGVFVSMEIIIVHLLLVRIFKDED